MSRRGSGKGPSLPKAPAAPSSRPAFLALEDGSIFEGRTFGSSGDAQGEVVFNTSMAGYQEILTDPSYRGQMVVMTVSHVGNYGINPEDAESSSVHVAGFIVREACHVPSNWRSKESLPAYLARHRVTGIEGVDTRALVALLRTKGALRGVIVADEARAQSLVKRARSDPRIEDRDLVQEVSCAAPYEWTEGIRIVAPVTGQSEQLTLDSHPGDPYKVTVVDCGVKRNILRSLVSAGCRVRVVPSNTTASSLLASRPDGVLFSNGPGDPDRLPFIVEAVKGCIGKVPVFGICLGHQVIGKALGGRTYKLKFGHHGGNHPVRDEVTRAVAITSQNHNYAVDPKSLPSGVSVVTHINLNDGTVEGVRHARLPVKSIQYHPEAAPGPHDASGIFREFVAMIAASKGRG